MGGNVVFRGCAVIHKLEKPAESQLGFECVASRVSHETPRGAPDNTGELGKYPLCPAVCLGKGWAEVLQAKLGMPVDVRALCFTQSP